MLALVLAAILIYQLSRRIPHCEADSILISREAGQLVVSHGQWKVQNSLFQATGNYSGMISYYSPQQQLQRREPVDVSFELRHSFSGAALRSETTAISYNLANRASPQNIERYISAGLAPGHVNYGWIYRLQNVRYVIGNNANPSVICKK
ncbi:hypothetical protein N172_17980 [Pantoea dispersa EGD-AAK13]|nr:hypothetical protein N172_17980 [Pantoea dispersa EGD-AAK13]PPC65832.1 hypothetical protein C1Y43_19305 [Pantoea sp. ICBG 828]PPC67968.1 hypothetical protein C1Y42_20835 [Pantoea sp. ICBG 985]